ncbi:hypothetical protein BD413DRAFT_672876 [Trametes elegans]|nr:hypothetical protein BD413DRAFT_672876 [Trametes elegans]
MTVTSQAAAEEPEELIRFRQQWIEEVRGKKKATASQDDHSAHAAHESSSASPDSAPVPARSPHANAVAQRRLSHGAPSSPPKTRRLSTSVTPAPFGPALQRAVDIYRKAVQHEQRSELDEALRLYRTAFRMDNNVDRAYHLLDERISTKAGAPSSGSAAPIKAHHRKTSSVADASPVDTVTHGMQNLDIAVGRVPVAHARGEGFVTGTLAGLISSWPVNLAFESEDEKTGTPIQLLPDELLIHVLRLLDTTTLERFAAVNRKARVITLDASIWRPIVQAVLKPPQISEEFETLILKYMTDYRRAYIEHPRVRYDGVYIAVCHYIRNGIGENVWVNHTHLITYYRYLRFLPDGQVLSLLTNEDFGPQQVIPLLKPTLRMKGFFIGTWYLDGTDVHIEELLDPAATEIRFSFQMILHLRSRPLGRWNRLDFREYDSVRITNGEATPLTLKNERPFWFSKVRSYA